MNVHVDLERVPISKDAIGESERTLVPKPPSQIPTPSLCFLTNSRAPSTRRPRLHDGARRGRTKHRNTSVRSIER
jgi:hypothetical protein